MFLDIDMADDEDRKVDHERDDDTCSLARIQDRCQEHQQEADHAEDRDQRIAGDLVGQVFHFAAFCDVALTEVVLLDADAGVHEDVAAADEVDDQQIDGIRCEELSQDADQAEQHGDDQRADRNTVLGGLGEEFRRLSEFAERPEISCARVCPVVAGCQRGGQNDDVDQQRCAVHACIAECIDERAAEGVRLAVRQNCRDDCDCENDCADQDEQGHVDGLAHLLLIFQLACGSADDLGAGICIERCQDNCAHRRNAARECAFRAGEVGEADRVAAYNAAHHADTDDDEADDQEQFQRGNPEGYVTEQLRIKDVQTEHQGCEDNDP